MRLEKTRGAAEASDNHVMLGTRDWGDVIVLDSGAGSWTLLALDLRPGTRLSLASSIAGAAPMAALPEVERCYLQWVLERKARSEWPSQRRGIAEKISQIHELGFCMSLGEWVPEIGSIAVLACIQEHPPWVLACIVRTSRMTHVRVERELVANSLGALACQGRLCRADDHISYGGYSKHNFVKDDFVFARARRPGPEPKQRPWARRAQLSILDVILLPQAFAGVFHDDTTALHHVAIVGIA